MTETKDLNRFWNAYKERRLGLIGLAILLFFIVMAVFAPYIAPYDPHELYKPRFRPFAGHKRYRTGYIKRAYIRCEGFFIYCVLRLGRLGYYRDSTRSLFGLL